MEGDTALIHAQSLCIEFSVLLQSVMYLLQRFKAVVFCPDLLDVIDQ